MDASLAIVKSMDRKLTREKRVVVRLSGESALLREEAEMPIVVWPRRALAPSLVEASDAAFEELMGPERRRVWVGR